MSLSHKTDVYEAATARADRRRHEYGLFLFLFVSRLPSRLRTQNSHQHPLVAESATTFGLSVLNSADCAA